MKENMLLEIYLWLSSIIFFLFAMIWSKQDIVNIFLRAVFAMIAFMGAVILGIYYEVLIY